MSDSTRLVPTGPGWWWRQGNQGPYVEEVWGDANHAPYINICGSPVLDDGSWLAPIPSPEVCAALASDDQPGADAANGGEA